MKNALIPLSALVAAAIAAPAMEYGICAHVGGDEFDIHEREFAMMREAGITRVRFDLTWAQVEPKPGEWHFERYDRLLADAERHGIRPLPILDYDNPGAYLGTAWQRPDDWCRFVRAVVERYRPYLDVVEVWNEPNLPYAWKPAPDAAQYAELLRGTYETVKAAAPDIRVMMGGTAGADTDFIEGVYKAGGGPFLDIVNIHPYSWPNPPDGDLDAKIRKTRALLAKLGDEAKPIWITEHGWPTHRLQLAGAHAILAGFSIARPERAGWRVVVAKLGEDAPGEETAERLAGILPPGSTAEAWGPRRLAAELSTNAVDAVMLPKERFPLDALDALRAFVAEGGVVIALGGVPMYYAYRDGAPVEGVDCNAVKRSFHVGWKAWWTDKDLPDWMRAFATDEAVAHGYRADPAGYRVERFLTDEFLAPGDRMVPLLVGTDKAGKPAVAAAVYLFGSDLKGAFIASSCDVGNGGTSEADQAKFLVRSLEIAEAEGVEAYLPYELQAWEGDPLYSEHHFGLCHRDLSPKPAWEAYRKYIQRRARH